MKLMRKLSTDPMGNLVNPMPIIGYFEVCQAKDQSLFSFKVHYHVLDLSLKVSLKAFLERLFVMVILPMTKLKVSLSQIVGRMFVVIG